jgi:hypothetical protein
MGTNLRVQRQVLEPAIRRHLPQARFLTFTIPWVFGSRFEEFASEIPPSTVIVDWDYNLTEESLSLVAARLRRYGQFGHRVWFMPTSGYAFDPQRDRAEQERAVRRQIGLARSVGVRDIVYFMGPFWWPTLEATRCVPGLPDDGS